MKEKDIIENAYIHLQTELGERIQWERKQLPVKDRGYDAVFTLDGERIHIQAKNEVRPAGIAQLKDLAQGDGEVIIVANYITPNAKKLLKELGLNYIDQAGNIWFRNGPVFIHIEGLANRPPDTGKKNRAFTKTGLKVIFHFLITPKLVNATYREIVGQAGVALGTVPKVFEGLEEGGYLIRKTEKEWLIKNYDELLTRWQIEYIRKLKPTLFVKRYRAINPEFYAKWKALELRENAQWGGEPAGDLITNYLKPEVFTIYTNQLQQDIMKFYKWIPDPEGEIWVFKKFWKEEKAYATDNHVPALLVYADLMETGESRCLETANKIHEQYLRKY